MVEFTPEKSKKIALARLDIVHQWLDFRKKSTNKLQADYDFVNLHNTSNSHLFDILGKISRGTLHRWKNILNGTEDYTKLIPQYKYAKVDEYRTCLTDEEIKIFMGLLLHPNRLCIGKAIALTKYKLKEQGQSYIPADITFRKYANWFKKNNYDKWVLARDGEKALSDKVEPYIKRDASLLEVGDILVADGHKLAFRAKYFTDDKGFTELGFNGLYSKLGIETVFARPYNARAKVIERFFKEFQEGFEKLLPSYVGSSIDNKPAYLMRNEKLHSQLHNDFVPTLDETIKMIDMWLNFKNSQPCPNAPNKTIAEVLEERKRQNININLLDDLMLATEVKTIQRNGVRFLNCDYFDERLYGFKSKVLIKYNLFDLTSIKVYTTKGEYLCTAGRVTEIHPMAKLLGTVTDFEDYKQKIVKQRKLHKKTINSVKAYLTNDETKFLETKILEENSNSVQTEFKVRSKGVQKIFKNNSEKCEYLIKNDPNNSWIIEFKNSKEYKLLYE